jgi:hypothetical protein
VSPSALGDATVCQGNEALPAAVSAIRVTLGAEYGSSVHLRASQGSRILTQGTRGPEWTSGSVTSASWSCGARRYVRAWRSPLPRLGFASKGSRLSVSPFGGAMLQIRTIALL